MDHASGRLESMPQLLIDMSAERARQVFAHPLIQDVYYELHQLIVDLRRCQTFEDYYHFQQELLGEGRGRSGAPSAMYPSYSTAAPRREHACERARPTHGRRSE